MFVHECLGVPRDQKRVLDSFKLEFYVVVSYPPIQGAETKL